MAKLNWKHLAPASLSHAMELCLDYAREKHNRSVDRIADLMGLANKWRLYKWVAEGNMPVHLLRPFEHACGCDYVTRYLAHSGSKLLVDIPTGRAIGATEVQELQGIVNESIGKLIGFAAGTATQAEVLAAATRAMEALAWHHNNIAKHQQPELEF